MNNRYEIAREFANAILSYDIKIILFGSVARGDDTEESDIDISSFSPIGAYRNPSYIINGLFPFTLTALRFSALYKHAGITLKFLPLL